MTRTIRMKDIAGLKANTTTAPYATTEPAKIGGVRGGGVSPDPTPQGVIFQENFGAQPDWHSGLEVNDTGESPTGLPDRVQRASTHQFPNGWHSCYQDPTWSPSLGHPDRREAISILDSDAAIARSNSKCYVATRDSYDPGWNRWNSDSSLLKYFQNGYDQLYVEFYIKFSPTWDTTPNWASKLFRISSWSEQGSEFQAFGGGELGPICLWDWQESGFGLRNIVSLRGGSHGADYGFNTDKFPSPPRSFVGSGDLPLNFAENTNGMEMGGTNPQIPDKLNGGFLSDHAGNPTHERVYGSTWNRIEFFVKMNSDINTNDGVLSQWVNGARVLHSEQIKWATTLTALGLMPKWNVVLIGGNDNFQEHPNADRYQDWYAIDDITVRDSLPEERQ